MQCFLLFAAVTLSYLLHALDALSISPPSIPHERQGNTPLHIAACYGHRDVAAYLVKHKASIHSRNDRGWTPLHYAAYNNSPKVVELLLGCDGIDVTAVDKHGKTALQDAERYGYAECATLIKAFIASPAFGN